MVTKTNASQIAYIPAGNNAIETTINDKLRRVDAQLDFLTISDLVASNKPPIGPGTAWSAGNHKYIEAEQSSTDYGVVTAGGVKLKWLKGSSYSLEYFGLTKETVPVSDQRAQVQKMLDFLAGSAAFVSGTASVGIASPVNISSNTFIEFEGLTLFGLSSWGFSTFAIVAKQIQNVRIKRLTFDGNSAAFGGLYPEVAGSGPKGFIIWDGCKNVYFEDCISRNVNSNGFISFAGGNNDSSENTGFIRCIADTCGVGMGQEIWSAALSAQTAKFGPMNVLYDNCKSINCNFGLYLAGGTWDVRGGYFETKRNQTLTLYCGDSAWSTTPAKGIITGGKFVHLGTEGANPVISTRGIAVADGRASYGQQPECEYKIIGCEFEHRAGEGLGSIWTAYEGPNITALSCKFSGAQIQVDHRVDSLAPVGTYREGKLTLVDPVFSNWGSNSIFYCTKPVEIISGTWINPYGSSADCVGLTTGSNIILRSPIFGSLGSLKQPRLGISNGTGLIPKRFLCQDAINNGLSVGLTNAPLAARPFMIFERSTPASTFDYRQWVAASAAPTTGSWAKGDIVYNSSPTAGGPIGWSCVVAGTPGTWVPFGQTGALTSVSAAPSFVGQTASVAGIGYFATGTASAADWKQITN